MDREEFLQTLVKMYPSSFNQNNFQLWMDGYKRVLPENLDFKHLLDKLLTEYLSLHNAPAPAWFAPYVPLVKPKIKKIHAVQKKGEPPTQGFLDLKNKLGKSIEQKSSVMAS